MKKILVVVFLVFLSLPIIAQDGKQEASLAQDILVKSEVETAISMLKAIYTKHKEGEMSLVQAKKLGADLLRELRYGAEGYFWADTAEGVNVVLYGQKDVEGKSRLEDKDKKGVFYVKEILAKGKAGGGYVEYWFPKKKQTVSQPKRSYVLLFRPFGWVIGSGYYLDAKSNNKNSITQLKQFVEQGAKLISQKGEKAFDAFRKKGSKWFNGNRYLFVWDLNGMRYVYPPDRKGEGQNVRGIKDADGKPIGELFIQVASSPKGKGWVHYSWPKPSALTPSWKSTYIIRVTSPAGKTFLVGSGAYDMPVQKVFVVDAVDSAVRLLERKGAKVFETFRDRRSQYLYQDMYVFVIAENGMELLNAAFPKLEGRNVLDYHDSKGNYFVKEFIRIAKNKGKGWVNYDWPKPGDVEKLQKSTYVRKAMVDGKMVVVCAGLYKE